MQAKHQCTSLKKVKILVPSSASFRNLLQVKPLRRELPALCNSGDHGQSAPPPGGKQTNKKQMRDPLLSLKELPGYKGILLGTLFPAPRKLLASGRPRFVKNRVTDPSSDLKPNLWGPSLGGVAQLCKPGGLGQRPPPFPNPLLPCWSSLALEWGAGWLGPQSLFPPLPQAGQGFVCPLGPG